MVGGGIAQTGGAHGGVQHIRDSEAGVATVPPPAGRCPGHLRRRGGRPDRRRGGRRGWDRRQVEGPQRGDRARHDRRSGGDDEHHRAVRSGRRQHAWPHPDVDRDRLPGRQPQRAFRPDRLRGRPRVPPAVAGDQLLRQADQRRRRHQRPPDPRRHRQLRPDQRRRQPGGVQGLDRGEPRRVRGGGRAGNDRRRRATMRHAGGQHAADLSVDDGDGLDHQGCAVPLVDRARPGGDAPGAGDVGAERQPHRHRRQTRHRGERSA